VLSLSVSAVCPSREHVCLVQWGSMLCVARGCLRGVLVDLEVSCFLWRSVTVCSLWMGKSVGLLRPCVTGLHASVGVLSCLVFCFSPFAFAFSCGVLFWLCGVLFLSDVFL
jgi:hypothetical protein